jgi:hypothetical protein
VTSVQDKGEHVWLDQVAGPPRSGRVTLEWLGGQGHGLPAYGVAERLGVSCQSWVPLTYLFPLLISHFTPSTCFLNMHSNIPNKTYRTQLVASLVTFS